MIDFSLLKQNLYSISHSDVLAFLKTIPDQSVDLILTDPPYESLEKHRAIGSDPRLKNWFSVIPNSMFEDLFKEFFRILKKNCHLYVFADQETMFAIKPIGEKHKFKFWKPIIWDKCKIGMGFHYRARYETILFFEKGKRKLNNLGIPDVLAVKKIYNKYPTEKPVDLLKIFLEQSTTPGCVVLDPFMGSGSCGQACLEMGRLFIGNDISQVSIDLATKRLEDIKAGLVPVQLDLPLIESDESETNKGEENE
jgi:site-specific DNA-methyltransferase (adenine-specific)